MESLLSRQLGFTLTYTGSKLERTEHGLEKEIRRESCAPPRKNTIARYVKADSSDSSHPVGLKSHQGDMNRLEVTLGFEADSSDSSHPGDMNRLEVTLGHSRVDNDPLRVTWHLG
ncbi:hypothetical protein DPMN_047253 [Dreissena polymorpha]|uniref:Uncharacterized protein n=1 Tax=Dreissena polymorpha TaxID=45954 RepID=A0A9D4D9D5_DREPO|nr:hypothetical protein DPMN_047253 [Dreissena polymorpha]